MTDSAGYQLPRNPRRPRIPVPGDCAFCEHLYDDHDFSVGAGTPDAGCPQCEGGVCRDGK